MPARYAVEPRKWADEHWAAQVEFQIDKAKAWAAPAAGRHDEAPAHSAQDREDVLESARDSRTDRAGAGTGRRFIAGGEEPSETLAEFDNALKNAPRRVALAAGARAAELAGEQDKAERLKTELSGSEAGI